MSHLPEIGGVANHSSNKMLPQCTGIAEELGIALLSAEMILKGMNMVLPILKRSKPYLSSKY